MSIITNGHQDLKLRVGLLEVHDSVVETGLSILSLVVGLEGGNLSLLEPGERVDDMGAEVRLDVLGRELAVLGPVLRPVGVVAHHLVAVLVGPTIVGADGVAAGALGAAVRVESVAHTKSVHAGGNLLVAVAVHRRCRS